MEYTIVQHYDEIKFLKRCNELIGKGWIPLGGVSMAMLESCREKAFAQAFVKNTANG